MKVRTQEVRDTAARGCIQATCEGAKLINQRTYLNFGKDDVKDSTTIFFLVSTRNDIPCVCRSSGL